MDWGDQGTLVNGSTGSGYSLGGDFPLELMITVSGDVTIGYAGVDIIDGTGKYFGHDTAEISEGGGYMFAAQNFNSFEYGAVLGTVSAGFNFDTLAFSGQQNILELSGNTIKLQDNMFYDANYQGFWDGGSELPVYNISGSTLNDEGGNPIPAGLYAVDNSGSTKKVTSVTGDSSAGFVAVSTISLEAGTNLDTILAGSSEGNTMVRSSGGVYDLSSLSTASITATDESIDIFSGSVSFSDMVAGAQFAPTPYWAGGPVSSKAMSTEQNIKALMLGTNNQEHWANDPSQTNTTSDDIIITYSFVQDGSSKFTPDNGSTLGAKPTNRLGYE